MRWKNAGWDYTDQSGIPQSSSRPFATATFARNDRETEIEFESEALTSLLEGFRSGAIENWGLFTLRDPNGRSQPYVFGALSSVADTKKPQLLLKLASGARRTVYSDRDVTCEPSTSTVYPGADVDFKPRLFQNSIFYFDLSAITERIERAVFRLTTAGAGWQFGEGPTVFSVCRVDLRHLQDVSVPFEPGVAAQYYRDRGLAGHPDIVLLETFRDDELRSRGWVGEHGPNGGCVSGATDGRFPQARYEPLYEGATALRAHMTAYPQPGHAVGCDWRWLFHGNLGPVWKNPGNERNSAEPDEIYIRCYIRFGDDWNPSDYGGKGWGPSADGTYNPIRGKGPSGYPWMKADAPKYAGNGQNPTNGVNGWSVRTCYNAYKQSEHKGTKKLDPVFAAGYRNNYSYVYWAYQRTVGGEHGGPGEHGSSFSWDANLGGLFEKNKWYCIEMRIKLNSIDAGRPVWFGDVDGLPYPPGSVPPAPNKTLLPMKSIGGSPVDGCGNTDGVLEVWVDGRKVKSRSDLVWRHRYDVQIWGIWLNMISGGQPQNCEFSGTAYMTHIAVGKSYIGPMNPNPATGKATAENVPTAPFDRYPATVMSGYSADYARRMNRWKESDRTRSELIHYRDFSSPIAGTDGYVYLRGGAHVSTTAYAGSDLERVALAGLVAAAPQARAEQLDHPYAPEFPDADYLAAAGKGFWYPGYPSSNEPALPQHGGAPGSGIFGPSVPPESTEFTPFCQHGWTRQTYLPAHGYAEVSAAQPTGKRDGLFVAHKDVYSLVAFDTAARRWRTLPNPSGVQPFLMVSEWDDHNQCLLSFREQRWTGMYVREWTQEVGWRDVPDKTAGRPFFTPLCGREASGACVSFHLGEGRHLIWAAGTWNRGPGYEACKSPFNVYRHGRDGTGSISSLRVEEIPKGVLDYATHGPLVIAVDRERRRVFVGAQSAPGDTGSPIRLRLWVCSYGSEGAPFSWQPLDYDGDLQTPHEGYCGARPALYADPYLLLLTRDPRATYGVRFQRLRTR